MGHGRAFSAGDRTKLRHSVVLQENKNITTTQVLLWLRTCEKVASDLYEAVILATGTLVFSTTVNLEKIALV